MSSLALLLTQLFGLFLLSRALQLNLSAALSRLAGNSKAVGLMAFIFLPGTLIHELSHLLSAWILLVKAGGLTLWPKRHGNTITMGQVQVPKVDPLRMFIISLAPMIVGLAIILGLSWWANQNGWYQSWQWSLIFAFIIFQLNNSLFPSGADLKAASHLIYIAIIIAIIVYVLGYRPTWPDLETLAYTYQTLWQTASALLWPALIINTIAVTSCWLLSKTK